MVFEAVLRLAAAAALAAPGAYDLLSDALARPDVAYEGQVAVETRAAGGEPVRKTLEVRYSPPGLYHRTIRDAQGRTERTIVSDGRTEWTYLPSRRRAWKGPARDPDSKVLGPEEELDLLRRNYDLRVAGQGTVAGRRAWVVEVRPKEGGAPARRLWVDREHGLLLRSESNGADGRPETSMAFSALRLSAVGEDVFRFSPPEGTVVVPSPVPADFLEPDDPDLEGLDPRAPGWLPRGYVLESAALLPAGRRGSRQVLHLRFSDGLDALSFFQAPAGVRFGARGRPHRQFRRGGLRARLYLDGEERILVWRRDGRRLILVGRVAADDLLRVAESVR